ncbi:MAG: carboxypeptidase-like regulatory domain-containing protein, partial [Actinomycetota bacterium]|nr:carboxypeptidase-like regulatory domain-containing protein [Actinomycetota bacterium]
MRARVRGAAKGTPPLRSVETDERGAFEIQGLPDEGLMVVARAEGFLETREPLDAGVRYHEVVMPRVARVAGTVTDAFSGEPLTNFSVRVSLPQHPNVAKRGGGRTQQVKDEEGHWQSPPLPAGSVVNIEVQAKGYAPKVVEGLVARVGAEPGDSVVGLSFGATLFGLVETQDGMPLANAKLRLVAGDGAAASAGGKGGGSPGRSTQTDAGGNFEFDNVASGDVRVVVEGGDAGVFVHPTRIPDNVSQWPVMIRVEAQGRVVGVVRRADGQFDADADVVLTAVEVPGLGQRAWQEKADGLGRFSFDDLPFGVYRVGRLQTGDAKREAFARHIAVTSREPSRWNSRRRGSRR